MVLVKIKLSTVFAFKFVKDPLAIKFSNKLFLSKKNSISVFSLPSKILFFIKLVKFEGLKVFEEAIRESIRDLYD